MKEKFCSITLFLLFLVNTLTISNAAISIITAIAAIIALYYAYKNRKYIEIPKIIWCPIVLFGAMLIISSVAIEDNESLVLCIKNIFWISYFFIAFLLVQKIKNTKPVFWALQISLLMLNLVAANELLHTKARLSGIYNNPNYFAFVLELLIPICTAHALFVFKKSKRIIIKYSLIVNALLSFIVLYATGSRGAILGIITSFLIVFFFRKYKFRKFVRFVISTIILFLFAFTAYMGPDIFKGTFVSRSYDRERVLMMQSTYNMWSDHKVFGVGMDNWQKQYQEKYISPDAKEPKIPHCHNVYLYYFSQTGILGGIAFIILTLSILYYLWSNIYLRNYFLPYAMLCTTISLDIHAFFDLSLCARREVRLFFLLLGVVAAVIVQHKAKSNKVNS